MKVPAAYIGVVLIASTTPLAVQWSGNGPGFLFSTSSRIALSAVLAVILVSVLRLPMSWSRNACYSYLAAGLGIFCSMLAVHWSAQYIPSGWIAVIFGLAPISTGMMAVLWLDEPPLTIAKLAGIALGIGGLIVIFGQGATLSKETLYGVCGMLLAVLSRSASAVWIKRIHEPLNGLVLTTGGLLIATPLFLLLWFGTGNIWPDEIGDRAAASIIYLAVFATLISFALYYYLLRTIDLTRVALITLISPVCALLLGMQLNNETVSLSVWIGTLLILSGLVCFEFDEKIAPKLKRIRESN